MEETQPGAVAAAETFWIDLTLVDFPSYARPHLPEQLRSLADDMYAHGQLQEIIVVPTENDRYEVVTGVGRVQAARQLGWERIRAQVRTGVTTFDKIRMTLSENDEREQANPFYRARLYRLMMEAEQIDQITLARKLNKSKGLISQYLSIADQPDDLLQKFNRLNLGLAHWLEIVKLPEPSDRLRVAEDCSRMQLSVRQLRAKLDQRVEKAYNQIFDSSTETPVTKPKTDPNFRWSQDKVELKAQFDPYNENIDVFLAGLKIRITHFLDQTRGNIEPGSKPETAEEALSSSSANN